MQSYQEYKKENDKNNVYSRVEAMSNKIGGPDDTVAIKHASVRLINNKSAFFPLWKSGLASSVVALANLEGLPEAIKKKPAFQGNYLSARGHTEADVFDDIIPLNNKAIIELSKAYKKFKIPIKTSDLKARMKKYFK